MLISSSIILSSSGGGGAGFDGGTITGSGLTLTFTLAILG
jgi:hypothetical protein